MKLEGIRLIKEKIHFMDHFRCQRCEKEFHHESPRYIVEIKSFEDFDGLLEDTTGKIDGEIIDLLKQIEDIDLQALEDDAYQEIRFILCKDCKDQFVRNPFHPYKDYLYIEETKGTIH
jgi:hypothetical protein